MIYNSLIFIAYISLSHSYLTSQKGISLNFVNKNFAESPKYKNISKCKCSSVCSRCNPSKFTQLNAMGKTIIQPETDPYIPNINIRFINTVSGKDVVTSAPLGSNLLMVGDAAGVKLPRACRTGLCGSCTCEVKDPNAIDGFATIRACSANVYLAPGEQEMVVDVYRMKQGQVGGARKTTKNDLDPKNEESETKYTDPMARFSDGWENKFISPSSASPQWGVDSLKKREIKTLSSAPTSFKEKESEAINTKLLQQKLKEKETNDQFITDSKRSSVNIAKSTLETPPSYSDKGMWDANRYLQVQTQANTNDGHFGGPKQKKCAKCNGLGRIVCYNCNGAGKILSGATIYGGASVVQCNLCVGMCNVSCAACRGSGALKMTTKKIVI